MSKSVQKYTYQYLSSLSTLKKKEVLWIDCTPSWIQTIITYLKDQVLPDSKKDAQKTRRRVLYKRGFSSPLLRCTENGKANYSLREIHEEVYINHSKGLALTQKILKQGYYWPILKRDALGV